MSKINKPLPYHTILPKIQPKVYPFTCNVCHEAINNENDLRTNHSHPESKEFYIPSLKKVTNSKPPNEENSSKDHNVERSSNEKILEEGEIEVIDINSIEQSSVPSKPKVYLIS